MYVVRRTSSRSERTSLLIEKLTGNESLDLSSYGVIGRPGRAFTPHGFVDATPFMRNNRFTGISYTSQDRSYLEVPSKITREVTELFQRFDNIRNSSKKQYCEIVSGSKLDFIDLNELFLRAGSLIKELDVSILKQFSTVTEMSLFSMIAILYYLNASSSNPSYNLLQAIEGLNMKWADSRKPITEFLNEHLKSEDFGNMLGALHKDNLELYSLYYNKLEPLLTIPEANLISGIVGSMF